MNFNFRKQLYDKYKYQGKYIAVYSSNYVAIYVDEYCFDNDRSYYIDGCNCKFKTKLEAANFILDGIVNHLNLFKREDISFDRIYQLGNNHKYFLSNILADLEKRNFNRKILLNNRKNGFHK